MIIVFRQIWTSLALQVFRRWNGVCDATTMLLDEYSGSAHLGTYTEQEPHPKGQAFRARFPWQNHPQTRVMKATVDGPHAGEKRRVMYGEPLEQRSNLLAEEIVAENRAGRPV